MLFLKTLLHPSFLSLIFEYLLFTFNVNKLQLMLNLYLPPQHLCAHKLDCK